MRSIERRIPGVAVRARVINRVEGTVSAILRRLPLAPGERLLVAVSGGADSVALLCALHRLQPRAGIYQLGAAHLNHRLRGSESERDAAFVGDLCRRLGIELVLEHARGLRPQMPNLEERARQLRYEFLNRAARQIGARYIALGHHADDQAETVLLRLLRGSGAAGLSAMAEVGPGQLLRPLLSLRKSSLLAYLAAIGEAYVTDASNFQTTALRNRIRHVLLPLLERDFAPGLVRHLIELAFETRELEDFLVEQARRMMAGRLAAPDGDSDHLQLKVEGLSSLAPATVSAMMRELLLRGTGSMRGFERRHIQAMRRVALGKHPSVVVVLPGGWRFRRQYATAVLERWERQMPQAFSSMLTAGENRIDGSALSLTLQMLTKGQQGFPASPWHPPTPNEAYIDAAAVGFLSARSWAAGDRIKPLGISGSRKVHDVFIDRKVALAERGSWPLVVAGDDVLWIPGVMRSRLALITPEAKKVVVLRAKSVARGGESSIA